jgi:hypothetical protein
MPARSRAPANEKTRCQFPGAGFEILVPVICPTCQIIQAGQRAVAVRFKKPATDFPAQALKFLRRWEYARDLPDVSNSFLNFRNF